MTAAGESLAEKRFDDGTVLRAPGLFGSAALRPQRNVPQTDGGKLFDLVLSNSGFARRPPIVIEHSTEAIGDVHVDVEPKVGHHPILVVHDAGGGLTFHGPDPRPHLSDSAAVTFTIPSARFGDPALLATAAVQPTSTTGDDARPQPTRRQALLRLGPLHLFPFHLRHRHDGLLAKKAVSVLEHPIEALASTAAADVIKKWDVLSHHPTVRWLPPAPPLKTGQPLAPSSWQVLDRTEKPVLLFIHGIFSSCAGGFGAIDSHTWDALRTMYDGRIIGYDHPTVALDPAQNAQHFLDQIPEGVKLNVDIVCHSRGGLVARSLAGQTEVARDAAAQKLTIRKIVFAATPNGGSEITDDDVWDQFLDRIATMLTLPASLLPIPVDDAAAVLGGVLELAKLLGTDAADQLPGFDAMRPGGEFIERLSAYQGDTPEYFAAEADFRAPAILSHAFKLAVGEDVVRDAVFPGVRNDVAVPTLGVGNPADRDGDGDSMAAVASFPVTPDRLLTIGPGSEIWHCNYFSDATVGGMRDSLVEWLSR